MTIKDIKNTKPRVKTVYSNTLGIQLYGEDNLYPQEMEKHIAASSTGSICLERYATFIEGNGLNDSGFANFVCNRDGETMDDVFHLVAQDVAKHNGFALHVYYDDSFRICELQHVPFKACRLKEETEDGKVRFIVYHPDWSGKKTRNGKQLRVDKKTVQEIYTFNPNKQIVADEIDKDGGLQNFRGQILWVSLEGGYQYPKSIFDKCITNISTDEGLDNVQYRNVRNNFLPGGMLIRKKGLSIAIDEDGTQTTECDTSETMRENLATFQGDENTGAILDIEIAQDEDKPEWIPIEAVNFDKKFDITDDCVTEKIYSAFGQEPFLMIRKGKTGFSGSVIKDAYDYYNSYVARERNVISRAFRRISENWNSIININGDYSIQPLVLINQSQG